MAANSQLTGYISHRRHFEDLRASRTSAIWSCRPSSPPPGCVAGQSPCGVAAAADLLGKVRDRSGGTRSGLSEAGKWGGDGNGVKADKRRWQWLGLRWPELSTTNSKVAAGFRVFSGTSLRLASEHSSALMVLYDVRWVQSTMMHHRQRAQAAVVTLQKFWFGFYQIL